MLRVGGNGRERGGTSRAEFTEYCINLLQEEELPPLTQEEQSVKDVFIEEGWQPEEAELFGRNMLYCVFRDLRSGVDGTVPKYTMMKPPRGQWMDRFYGVAIPGWGFRI